MALNYGVLKGTAVGKRFASGANPHYQIHLVDETTDYRVAVNVQSKDKSEVMYTVKPWFRHSIVAGLRELSIGFTRLLPTPGGLALDFIRSNLARVEEFVPLPLMAPGPDNDLNEKLDSYVQRAMADESAIVYAFGDRWGPENNKKDKIFGFLPGNGVHDIHMNQGNDAAHAHQDGVYQDGGLIFQFPATDQWVAIFLKFQSQAWHTDDRTGHTLHEAPPVPEPQGLPTQTMPDGLVRIVGARVNDIRSPEHETVTLLNASDQNVSLDGWKLLDKADAATPLVGMLASGQAVAFDVKPPMVLSNKGGLITLVNADGLKVDGVSYTKEQARNPGWTVVF